MEELYDIEIAAIEEKLIEFISLIDRLLIVNYTTKLLEVLRTITRISERKNLVLEDNLLLY